MFVVFLYFGARLLVFVIDRVDLELLRRAGADVVPPLVHACDEGRRDEEEEKTHGTCRKAVVARAEPTESRLKWL